MGQPRLCLYLPWMVSCALLTFLPALFWATQVYVPSLWALFEMLAIFSVLLITTAFSGSIVWLLYSHVIIGSGTPVAWHLNVASSPCRLVLLSGTITNSGKTDKRKQFDYEHVATPLMCHRGKQILRDRQEREGSSWGLLLMNFWWMQMIRQYADCVPFLLNANTRLISSFKGFCCTGNHVSNLF